MDWSTPAFPEIDFARDELADLHARLTELRIMGRFVPIRFHDRVACLITRYDDVRAAFLDEATFPAAAAHREHTEPVLGRTMSTMLGAEHKANRALVSNAFRPAAIRRAVEPLLDPLAVELIDRFVPLGRAELMEDFARPLAFRAITRFMGIPVEDEPQVQAWGGALLRFIWDPEPALDAADRMRGYLAGVVTSRRSDPGDDLISELTHAQYEGRRLTDTEIFTAILALFAAGIDNPSNAIGSLVHAVLIRPELEARLRAEPALLAGAAEELLRFEPSLALMPRKCPRAVHWRGMDFPADSAVIFGIASANRDPEAFTDPDRLDPERKTKKKMMSFGQGMHLCPGAHLARHTIQVALHILLEKLPDMRLEAPEAVEIVGGVLRGPRSLPVRFGIAA